MMTTRLIPDDVTPERIASGEAVPPCVICGTTGGALAYKSSRVFRSRGQCSTCYQRLWKQRHRGDWTGLPVTGGERPLPDCPNFVRLANARLVILNPTFDVTSSIAMRVLMRQTERALQRIALGRATRRLAGLDAAGGEA